MDVSEAIIKIFYFKSILYLLFDRLILEEEFLSQLITQILCLFEVIFNFILFPLLLLALLSFLALFGLLFLLHLLLFLFLLFIGRFSLFFSSFKLLVVYRIFEIITVRRQFLLEVRVRIRPSPGCLMGGIRFSAIFLWFFNAIFLVKFCLLLFLLLFHCLLLFLGFISLIFLPFLPQPLQLFLDSLEHHDDHAAEVDKYHSANHADVGPAELTAQFGVLHKICEQKHEIGGHKQSRLVKDLHYVEIRLRERLDRYYERDHH